MKMIKKSITALIAIFMLTSCAKEPPKEVRLPEGRRTRHAIALERELTRMKDATATLRGLAWVELKTPDEDWRTEAVVVLGRPDRIRMDAMDSLADVWAQLGSDGKTLWLYIPGKKKLYKGRATPRNMRRLTSFEWQPEEFISIIAGAPLIIDRPEVIEVESGKDAHFVDLASRLHIWTGNGKKGRISRCVRYAEGSDEVDYEIRFSDYRRTRGISFPHIIEAVFPSSRASIRIEYRDLSLGDEVFDKIFVPPSRREDRTIRLSSGR